MQSAAPAADAPPVGRALQELLQARRAGAAPLLIDVREPPEFSAGHLAGSSTFRLDSCRSAWRELARTPRPCSSAAAAGAALSACQLALQARIGSPANLDGGLLAWAAEIDPTLAVL